MYTREQASLMRQKFWTQFGKYMAPVASVSGEKINWINYKTGISHLFFRMNADKESAYIGIEMLQNIPGQAPGFYQQFLLLKPLLQDQMDETWIWEEVFENETCQTLSRIYTQLKPANIFSEADWPAIISFLKPRIIALDHFWYNHKMIFEMMD